jgi:thiamine-phosphate diphosphorylase
MSVLLNFLKTYTGIIPPFYIILDEETNLEKKIKTEDLYFILINEGIRLIQYRNKSKNESDRKNRTIEFINNITIQNDTCVILNDDLELAQELNIPVHLGQEDLSFQFSLIPPHPISTIGYGASSHNLSELERLRQLSEKSIGPDYTAFGSIFKSNTKPDLSTTFDNLDLFYTNNPSEYSVLIGGIGIKNLPILINYFNPNNNHYYKKTYFCLLSSLFDFGVSKNEIKKNINELKNLTS